MSDPIKIGEFIVYRAGRSGFWHHGEVTQTSRSSITVQTPNWGAPSRVMLANAILLRGYPTLSAADACVQRLRAELNDAYQTYRAAQAAAVERARIKPEAQA